MSSPATPAIDFSRVQYPHAPEPEAKHCRYCSRGLEGEYYKLQNQDACGVCVENVRGRFPADTHKAFSQALLWGIPAAVLAMAVYALIVIVTHFSIGFVAIGVAWLIVQAMLKGSHGVRGRRYQWTAVLLTYAAMAVAFIPIQLAFMYQRHEAQKPAVVTSARAHTPTQAEIDNPFPGDTIVAKAGSAAADNQFPAQDYSNVPPPPASSQRSYRISRDGKRFVVASPNTAGQSAPARHGFLHTMGILVGLGLISPFYKLTYSFGSGAIGLFILFWGMQYAWKAMVAPKVDVDGPIHIS